METIRRITRAKKEYLGLLLEADPSEEMIDRYLDPGEMYLLEKEGAAVCVAVVLPLEEGVEIKNIAVHEAWRRRGYGSRMLRFLTERYGGSGAVWVGTSDVVPDAIEFYSSNGFVYSHTLPGFFVENYPDPIYEGGIQCVDMVYLRWQAS